MPKGVLKIQNYLKSQFLHLKYTGQALFLMVLCLSVSLQANPLKRQFSPLDSLNYKTFAASNFSYHYPQALRDEAEQVALITEEMSAILMDKYSVHLPKPIDIIISNALYSNGQANSVLNQMRLWVTDWDIRMRTTHPWVQDVTTHEFTHLATIGLTPKLPTNIYGLQAFYQGYFNDPSQARVQWILPFRFHTAWLAEGISQYESSLRGFDAWDTHRDMIMRQAVLSDQILPLVKMDHFDSEKEIELETGPYTQGFHLVRFIAQEFGDSALVAIWQSHGEWKNWSLEACFESVLGLGSDSLFQMWRTNLKQNYQAQMKTLGDIVEGQKISFGSFNNHQLKVVRDSLFWLSNLRSNSWQESLVGMADSSLAKIKDSLDWAQFKDIKLPYMGDKILLNRGWDLDSSGRLVTVSYANRDAADRSQLDIIIIDKSQQYSLTHIENAFAPKVSPSNTLHYLRRWPFQTKFELVKGLQITDRILSEMEGLEDELNPKKKAQFYRKIAKSNEIIFNDSIYQKYSQVRSKQFNIYSFDISKEGDYLIDFYDGWNRQIAIIQGENVQFLKVEGTDIRQPKWANSHSFVYSWNLNGVFNIYRYDLSSNSYRPITHVSGGAFDPVMKEGILYYSSYDRDGFSLYRLNSYDQKQVPHRLPSVLTPRKPADFILPDERNFEGSEVNYESLRLKMIINPIILFEQRANDGLNLASSRQLATKIGANTQWVDPLMRHSLYSTFLTEYNQGVPLLDPQVQMDFFTRYDNWMFALPMFADFEHRALQVSSNYYSEDGVLLNNDAGISLSNLRIGVGTSLFRERDTLSFYIKANAGDQEIERIPSWTFTKSASLGFEFGQKGSIRGGPTMTPGLQYRIRNEYKRTDLQDSVYLISPYKMGVEYHNWETSESSVEALYATEIPWLSQWLENWIVSAKVQFQHLEMISSSAFVDTTDAWLQPSIWLDGYPFMNEGGSLGQSVLFRGDNTLLWEAHLQHPLWKKGFSWRGLHHRGAWLDWSYQAGQAWNGSIFDNQIWVDYDYARSLSLELRLSQKIFHSMPLEVYLKASKAVDPIPGGGGLEERLAWANGVSPIIRPTSVYFGITFQFLNPTLYQQDPTHH